MRSDAQRNRQRVLAAAEEVLAREGLSASMRTIAERAGVGLGTIYRHFPTQEALFHAIVAAQLQRLLDGAADLRAEDDAGAAFFTFFDRIVETATRRKALADALSVAGVEPNAGEEDVSHELRSVINELFERAQRAGAIRAGLAAPEILALLSAASLAAERSQWSDELRRRTLDIIFAGLRG